MIEIRYLQAESGANKFGTCNCCGKSSGEDPLMISIKFSYYGHGTLICLCDDCRKKLIEVLNGEQLPPANNSEIPNSSDTISRQAAINAIDECHCGGEDSCGEPWIYKENAVEAIQMIEPIPSAQPQRTCVNCGRTVNNGGWYADGGTRCPIEEHYALPKDGYCHLWEKRNVTDDDYPERRTDE